MLSIFRSISGERRFERRFAAWAHRHSLVITDQETGFVIVDMPIDMLPMAEFDVARIGDPTGLRVQITCSHKKAKDVI